MAVERLQKILSNAGVASRRSAEAMIVAGRVAVNGKTLDTLGARADPEKDEITVDGTPVIRDRYRYVALHKPAGVLSTTRDERGRPTVVSLIGNPGANVHPIGRLDQSSEGLILLTNDGALTDLLTHPRYEVRKEYLVAIDQALGRKGRQQLVRGVWHEGERLKADSVQMVSPSGSPERPDARWLLIGLHGGRKREIRRMLATVGRRVVTLRRIRIGPLALGALALGESRDLTSEEVDELYEVAKRAEANPRNVEAADSPQAATPSTEANPRDSAAADSPQGAAPSAEASPRDSAAADSPQGATPSAETNPRDSAATDSPQGAAPSAETNPRDSAAAESPQGATPSAETNPRDSAAADSPQGAAPSTETNPRDSAAAESPQAATPSTEPQPPRLVAIDGPAASGKSTLARALVERFGYVLLDTGLMYRAIALAALRAEVPASDEAACVKLAREGGLRLVIAEREARVHLAGEDVTDQLRSPEVEGAVSDYAAIAEVRRELVAQQRTFAGAQPSVLVGRDIGSVVLLDAPVKLFLQASEEVRAQRRGEQAAEWGRQQSASEASRDISSRDVTDSTRAASPLVVPEGAIVIDSGELDADAMIAAAMAAIEERTT